LEATMTALASAGIGMPWLTARLSLAFVPCGSIAVILPTFTPATRTSSPG
jgi:hypothetical protein